MLIFGGFGNESGRQELGGKTFMTLYPLICKQRGSETVGNSGRFPVCSGDQPYSEQGRKEASIRWSILITWPLPDLFYARYDLETGHSEVVSSSIPILSEEIITKVFLFHNAAMNELVTVIREYKDKKRANIRIYTLNMPAVSGNHELSAKNYSV